LTLYLDTSVLVAALTQESETRRMQEWLAAQASGDLAISDWVMTEFSSALSIKLRCKSLNPTDRASAMAKFARLCEASLEILPISSARLRAAARFLDQYSLGLRAGDALHLAIRADHGATPCTLDRRLSEAGPALGVKTRLL
jgi:predicted nucleic acid-binding protein